MTPLRVHFTVEDLDAGIGFYSTMFASMPTLRGPDHANWSLDDPPVHLTISRRRNAPNCNRPENFGTFFLLQRSSFEGE